MRTIRRLIAVPEPVGRLEPVWRHGNIEYELSHLVGHEPRREFIVGLDRRRIQSLRRAGRTRRRSAALCLPSDARNQTQQASQSQQQPLLNSHSPHTTTKSETPPFHEPHRRVLLVASASPFARSQMGGPKTAHNKPKGTDS